jgi:magnesium transporter
MAEALLSADQLADAWPILSAEERLEGFSLLNSHEAEQFFMALSSSEQATLLALLEPTQRRRWIRYLEPDDAADLIQAAPEEDRAALLGLLDEHTRSEVTALLAYAEDDAGGLMNPRFPRVRPWMTTEQALRYLRHQAIRADEPIHYAYVLDADWRLLGVVSLRELFRASPEAVMEDIMQRSVIAVREDTDQEEVARLFAEHGFFVIPVVDEAGRMKGIVTADDIMAVVQEEATEDIHKLGGTAALDEPYLQIGLTRLVWKRAIWLIVLLLGGTLTASALEYYEEAIAQVTLLAIFIPLIIASGGNAGSQASTLVIRAMALGEVRARDWWRVFRREIVTGLTLGVLLAGIGLLRIVAWEWMVGSYGEHYVRLAFTVALSLAAVVLWGSLAGSMLPFLLRRLGIDPAVASAPFIATLVDVTGIVLYFTIAAIVLRGTLL